MFWQQKHGELYEFASTTKVLSGPLKFSTSIAKKPQKDMASVMAIGNSMSLPMSGETRDTHTHKAYAGKNKDNLTEVSWSRNVDFLRLLNCLRAQRYQTNQDTNISAKPMCVYKYKQI